MNMLSVQPFMLASMFCLAACGVEAEGTASNGGDNGSSEREANANDAVFEFTALGTDAPEQFTEVDGTLYFQADVKSDDGGNDYQEVWATDGTVVGTQPVTEIQHSHIITPEELTAFDGNLYFNYAISAAGRDLLALDASSETGVRTVDGDESTRIDPRHLTVFDGKLYFSGETTAYGRELWVSDGTPEGTQMVKNINEELNAIDNYEDSRPENLTPAGDQLFFSADDGQNGRQLWVTDGSESGTRMVTTINPEGNASPNYLTALGDRVVFNAYHPDHPYEPWVSDGTEEGTMLLKHIHVEEVEDHPMPGSYPSRFIPFQEKLYFTAATNGFTNGNELWATDGTPEGTERVSEAGPGVDLAVYNDHLYFSASDTEYGSELWRSDGTEEGTQRVSSINPDGGISLRHLKVYRNLLFFTADDGKSADDNQQLWVTDGSTVLLASPDEALDDALSPQFADFEMKVSDGALYFIAAFDAGGQQLWRLEQVD